MSSLINRNPKQRLQAPYVFWGLIVRDFGVYKWHYYKANIHIKELAQEWKDFRAMWFMGEEL